MVVNIQEAARVSEAWEDFLQEKYNNKARSDFRDYEKAPPNVAAFYKENHEKQTVEHVLALKSKYEKLDKAEMGIWEATELLNSLVDDSDPDTEMAQTVHALQSAEAARKDGQPRWMILTALIHDLGKYLFFLGEPQWTVVGDTFPVGCKFADKIVHSEYFEGNPDSKHPVYSTEHGIYTPGCGLENVHMSYGHDEYLANVCKDYLPAEAVYVIRHHSFYAWHNAGEYQWLMNDHDREMFKWVKIFNQYDLYSKSSDPPSVEELKPYYEELIAEYFPEKIRW